MTPARRDTPAFTLTELLVVIGIVALMISIVLPLISQIRRSSLKRQMEIKAAAVQEPESATTAPVLMKKTAPAARVSGLEATIRLTPRLAVGMADAQSVYQCAFKGTFHATSSDEGGGVSTLALPLPPHVISLSDLTVTVDGVPSDAVDVNDGRLVWTGQLAPAPPSKLDVTYTAVGRGIYTLEAPRGGAIFERFKVELTADGSDVRFLELSTQPTSVTRTPTGTNYVWDYKRLMFGRPVALDVLGIAPIDRLGELSWLGPLSVVAFGLVLGFVSRAFPVANFDRWMLVLVLGTFGSAYPLMYFAQEFIALPYAVAAAAGAVLMIISLRAVSIMGLRLGLGGVVVPAGLVMGLALEAAVRPQLQGLLLTLLVIGLFVAAMVLAPRVRATPHALVQPAV